MLAFFVGAGFMPARNSLEIHTLFGGGKPLHYCSKSSSMSLNYIVED